VVKAFDGRVAEYGLLVDTGQDDIWRQLGRDRFSAAYSEEDSVHEQLIDGRKTSLNH
jgi:hypothetical protein